MAGAVNPEDIAARDDAHLQSLGIKPELRRTLGFLSNFAIAFSFISVSTGSFGNFGVGIGLGGPAFFWSWPLVVVGQLLVALVFAELASHFPVAGSIYQWSKRLSTRTLGWFTGWFYFWAQVVTVSAVAVIVGYVIAGFTAAFFMTGHFRVIFDANFSGSAMNALGQFSQQKATACPLMWTLGALAAAGAPLTGQTAGFAAAGRGRDAC